MVEEISDFERDIHTIEQLRNDPELCFAFGLAKTRLEIPLSSITRIAQEAYELYASIQCSEEEKTEFLFHLASGNFGNASSYIKKIASSKSRRSQDTKGSVDRINSVDIRPNPVYSQAIQAETRDYQMDSHTWKEPENLQADHQEMFGPMKSGRSQEDERRDEKEDYLKWNMMDEDRIDRGNEERLKSDYDYSMETQGTQISHPSNSTTPFNIIIWNKHTAPQPQPNYERAALLQPTVPEPPHNYERAAPPQPIASSPYLPQNSPSYPQPMISQHDKDLYSNQAPILYPKYTTYNLAFNPQAYLNKASSSSPEIASKVPDQSDPKFPLSEYNPPISPFLAYNPPVQPQPFQAYHQPTSDHSISNPKGDSMSIDDPKPSKSDQMPSQIDISIPPSHSPQPSKLINSSSSSSSINPEEIKQEDCISYTFSSPDTFPSPVSPSQPKVDSPPLVYPMAPPNPSIPSSNIKPPINRFPIVQPIITPGYDIDKVNIKIEDTFREVESSPQSPEDNISMEYEFMNEQSSEVLKDIKLEESIDIEQPSSNFNPTSYIEEEKTQPKAAGPSVSDMGNFWDHICYFCTTSLQIKEARTLKNCGHRFHNACFDSKFVKAHQQVYMCPIPECSKLIYEEAEEWKHTQNLMKSDFIVCPGINCGITLVKPKDKGFLVCDECRNVICLSCEKVHSDWYSCKHDLKMKS
jgi:hypothetical protein